MAPAVGVWQPLLLGLALAAGQESATSPPPASPPPSVFYHKVPASLIVLLVLLGLCICCGLTCVIAHWCGLGKALRDRRAARGGKGDGSWSSEVWYSSSEYFYGPNNDGRGAAGLNQYRSKQDAAEALEVIAERLRRSAISLMVFSFSRVIMLNGFFGVISACAVTCCASPPGLKGIIKSVSCARVCAIIAAVCSVLALIFGIALAVFGENASQGVDEACDAATNQFGVLTPPVEILKGPLKGESYSEHADDICGWVRDFFDYAVWICLVALILPDIGLLVSACFVAHFAKVLGTLSKAVGPMEVSPLMYR